MGKPKALGLAETERLALDRGFRFGEKHCFRMRCRAVLLKSEGIEGLKTRPGRGRKPIMDSSDEEAVRRAIEQDRQSVSKARAAWEQSSGKAVSDATFKRFSSALTQDISE